jgi:hypothetical protein
MFFFGQKEKKWDGTRLRMRPVGVESKKDMGARKIHLTMPLKYFCAARSPTSSTSNERMITKIVLPNASPT